MPIRERSENIGRLMRKSYVGWIYVILAAFSVVCVIALTRTTLAGLGLEWRTFSEWLARPVTDYFTVK